jgi:hypothetical protein
MCRPVHLLGALSELDGPIGAALIPPNRGVLLARPAEPAKVYGGGSSYLCGQTQGAVSELAASRNEQQSPAHLLLAVIDQSDAEAMNLLEGAGIDPAEVRLTALKVMGAPLDLPPIQIPPLIAAGYWDRPILVEEELDEVAWKVLLWRQAHLPLDALRNSKDWECLRSLEVESARRVYRRLRLHEDQELSLFGHHLRRVQELAHNARPDLVAAPPDPRQQGRFMGGRPLTREDPHFPRHWQPFFLSFTIGWACWFGNRWAGMKSRWSWLLTRAFAFRTRASYRGCPNPSIGESG